MKHSQPPPKRKSLPYGAGSLQWRHSSWWLVYRDPEGRVVQTNSWTQNEDEALRQLARASAPRYRAIATQLEEIASAAPKAKAGGSARPLNVTLVDRSGPDAQRIIDQVLEVLVEEARIRAAAKRKQRRGSNDAAAQETQPAADPGDLPGRARGNARNAGTGKPTVRAAAANRRPNTDRKASR